MWLALDERPSTATLAGGAIVILAIALQTREAPPEEPRPAGAALMRRRAGPERRCANQAPANTGAASWIVSGVTGTPSLQLPSERWARVSPSAYRQSALA